MNVLYEPFCMGTPPALTGQDLKKANFQPFMSKTLQSAKLVINNDALKQEATARVKMLVGQKSNSANNTMRTVRSMFDAARQACEFDRERCMVEWLETCVTVAVQAGLQEAAAGGGGRGGEVSAAVPASYDRIGASEEDDDDEADAVVPQPRPRRKQQPPPRRRKQHDSDEEYRPSLDDDDDDDNEYTPIVPDTTTGSVATTPATAAAGKPFKKKGDECVPAIRPGAIGLSDSATVQDSQIGSDSTMTVSEELDPDTHAEIFQSLQSIALAATSPVEQPVAILLGGQPGAGKSRLASDAMKYLGGNAVKVDADELRQFHPRYIDLMRENDLTASDRIHSDAGPWAVKLTRAAITARRNLIVDGTMRNSDNLVKLCRIFREAGYRVDTRVMAVSRIVSLLSIYERYERQRHATGFGRWVNYHRHDAAFAGVPVTVEKLEAYGLVDKIAIYARDNDAPIYENRLEQGIWQRPPAGRVRLDAERMRLDANSAVV